MEVSHLGRYYTTFFEKLSLAATQKAPLFEKMALSLNKLAFLSDEQFLDEMYKEAFLSADNEDILKRLSTTHAPSENFKKWVYCQLCKEFAIGIHEFNRKIDPLVSSIIAAHICFTADQIKFLKKNYADFKKQIKRIEKIIPVETYYAPNFMEENRKMFQHYYRQLQCYDFIFTQHGFLCDWALTNDSFESFVVRLCSNQPDLLEKIYFRFNFSIHEAILILFQKDFFRNYSGLDVLKFENAIREAVGENVNSENYVLLKNVVEVILHQPHTCPILYQFASLATEENLAQHTFVGEIISYSYVNQYMQMLFLIVSNAPRINIEILISDVLKPILEFEEDFNTHLSAAVLTSKMPIAPSVYRRGIECLIEYLEAFK